MARPGTIYDLVLLLSRTATDDDRTRVLSEVESAITGSGGSLERNQDWGTRPMTYRINHESEAEYHLLQFSGPASLLESLSHSLRISDNVLRFRIIKVIPGTPPAPESAPPVVAAASAAAHAGAASGGGGGYGSGSAVDAESGPESGAESDPDPESGSDLGDS
jgi:small subunit ribosomal protein S6